MPTYDGLLIKQREGDDALWFFAFAAPAKDILSWSDIQRTAELKGAAQRLKNDSHVKAIRGFMNASSENIIPTTVTLAVSPDRYKLSAIADKKANVTSAKLKLDSGGDEKAAVVIDGQHRLLAFEGLDETPPLLACAILGADDLERAMHFVVINNKTKRVPSDLVKAIMAELSPGQRETLKGRLTKVGITLGNYAVALNVLNTKKTSPFKDLVDWDINRKKNGQRRIKPAALEASLRAIISDLRAPIEIEVDDAIQILSAMWRGVRDSWGAKNVTWDAADKNDPSKHSRLVDKAGLVAVTEFIVARLNVKLEDGFDVTDLGAIEKFSKQLMKPVPARFWLMTWTEKGLDTSAGRGMIRESLSAIKTAAASGAEDPLQDSRLVPTTE